jgi:hypothetical protein
MLAFPCQTSYNRKHKIGGERSSLIQHSWENNKTLSPTRAKGTRGMAQVLEHLLYKPEVPCSNPSTEKKKCMGYLRSGSGLTSV